MGMTVMEGYVTKRGKRSGSRVRRYMRLEGSTLSNHHTVAGAPTWSVSVRDALITANARRCRITIELHHYQLHLFVDSPAEADAWYEALTDAKSRALLLKSSPSSPSSLSATTRAADDRVVAPSGDGGSELSCSGGSGVVGLGKSGNHGSSIVARFKQKMIDFQHSQPHSQEEEEEEEEEDDDDDEYEDDDNVMEKGKGNGKGKRKEKGKEQVVDVEKYGGKCCHHVNQISGERCSLRPSCRCHELTSSNDKENFFATRQQAYTRCRRVTSSTNCGNKVNHATGNHHQHHHNQTNNRRVINSHHHQQQGSSRLGIASSVHVVEGKRAKLDSKSVHGSSTGGRKQRGVDINEVCDTPSSASTTESTSTSGTTSTAGTTGFGGNSTGIDGGGEQQKMDTIRRFANGFKVVKPSLNTNRDSTPPPPPPLPSYNNYYNCNNQQLQQKQLQQKQQQQQNLALPPTVFNEKEDLYDRDSLSEHDEDDDMDHDVMSLSQCNELPTYEETPASMIFKKFKLP